MQRRDFLKYAGAIPISGALLSSVVAQAEECTDWIEIPGTGGQLQIKDLFAIDKALCRLFKLGPGFRTRAHKHPAGEYNYLVEGTFTFAEEGTHYLKGDYVYKEPGSVHPEGLAGPAGAIIFVFTPEPIVKVTS
jgi:quercetin dioxygenase-like cupin family protein